MVELPIDLVHLRYVVQNKYKHSAQMYTSFLHLCLPILDSFERADDKLSKESKDVHFEARIKSFCFVKPSPLLWDDLWVVLLDGLQDFWVHIINVEIVLEKLEFAASKSHVVLDQLA